MTRSLRPQDTVMALLLAAVAAVSPTHDQWEIGMIALLGLLQIAESKIPWVETIFGKVTWILLQIAIGYLLIGYTGGIVSSYYLFLLFPVFSAATALGVFGTLLFSLLSCGAYLSFVLFLGSDLEIPPDQWRILVLRLLFIALAGNLVNGLAKVLREQNIRYRNLTEELAEANQHLQQAEAAVRRSDRLAALGQLSAGLAHELRNPLGTIKASAEMLSRNISQENEVAAEMSSFISCEVDRTNSLVTRFLDFARPLSLTKTPMDVTKTIDRSILQVMREDAAARIEKQYAPDLSPIPIDSEMMEHVFYNVILNAVQASPSHNPVVVKTRRTGNSAEICVVDQGAGIDPAMSETIFNPFVTTKPQGVGLGLPIVAKIVDEHGGKLKVESKQGHGSTFRIYLPMT